MNLLLSAAVTLACGGASLPTADSSFHGPNELTLVLASPVQRELPPERNSGTARLVDIDERQAMVELTMVEGGDACRLLCSHTGGSAWSVQPGQQCVSHFAYDGAPVSARVSVEEGSVRFASDSMEVEMEGEFAADMDVNGVVTSMSGAAAFRFYGEQSP